MSEVEKIKKLLRDLLTDYAEHQMEMKEIDQELRDIENILKKHHNKRDVLRTLKKIHKL